MSKTPSTEVSPKPVHPLAVVWRPVLLAVSAILLALLIHPTLDHEHGSAPMLSVASGLAFGAAFISTAWAKLTGRSYFRACGEGMLAIVFALVLPILVLGYLGATSGG